MSQSEFVQSLRIAIVRGSLAGLVLAGIMVLALHATQLGVPSDEITLASYGSDDMPLASETVATKENTLKETVQVAFAR